MSGVAEELVPQTPERVFKTHRAMYHDALDRLYWSVPEYHGLTFRPRLDRYRERGVPVPLSIAMSFSRTLLDLVGGLEALCEFWEIEK